MKPFYELVEQIANAQKKKLIQYYCIDDNYFGRYAVLISFTCGTTPETKQKLSDYVMNKYRCKVKWPTWDSSKSWMRIEMVE